MSWWFLFGYRANRMTDIKLDISINDVVRLFDADIETCHFQLKMIYDLAIMDRSLNNETQDQTWIVYIWLNNISQLSLFISLGKLDEENAREKYINKRT